MIEILIDEKIFWKKLFKSLSYDFYIYGACNKAQIAQSYIKQTSIHLSGVIDKSYGGRIFNGSQIVTPALLGDKLKDKHYFVLVLIENSNGAAEDLRLNLKNATVLIPDRETPNFNKMISELRRLYFISEMQMLKQDESGVYKHNPYECCDITIISNNCSAGCIYGAMGMKINTPTVNMVIEPYDYIRLCKNLNYYMDVEIEVITYNHRGGTKEYYPIGRLHDIKVHFVHYSDWATAKAEWDRRKERINYSNLYFVFSDKQYNIPHLAAKEFSKLNVQHKIILQQHSFYGLPYSVYSNYDLCDVKTLYEYWFDIVGWLKGTETYEN